MSRPTLSNVSSPRGAPMGRRQVRAVDRDAPLRFYLRRIYLDSGGYDVGGAYWGCGTPLYQYQSVDEVDVGVYAGAPELGQVEGYLRAPSREDARRQVRASYPHARFFR